MEQEHKAYNNIDKLCNIQREKYVNEAILHERNQKLKNNNN